MGNFCLPLVPVIQEFLLVVQQLFVCLGRVLEVGSFHDGVHGTSLLTESTVDALGHVNVVPSCPPATISSFFSFYGDRLSRTNCFAQFTCDTSVDLKELYRRLGIRLSFHRSFGSK